MKNYKEYYAALSIVLAGMMISFSILFQNEISLNFKKGENQPLAQNTAPSAPTAPQGKVNVSEDDDPYLGSKDAKVVLVEFSDFQCPFCKSFRDAVFSQLKADYLDTGKARLVYRDYPLSFHPNAEGAAEAANCANAQGKFWSYHDTLFTKQDDWASLPADRAKNTYITYAGNIGLDTGAFTTCLNEGTYKAEIQKDFSDGNSAGVSGTPTVFVNGKPIVGAQPYETFKTAIEEELKNAK